MADAAPIYKPAWLQSEDVFDVFEAAGMDPPAAVEWLAGAHHNRGLAATKKHNALDKWAAHVEGLVSERPA
jgi:hypothetical protein